MVIVQHQSANLRWVPQSAQHEERNQEVLVATKLPTRHQEGSGGVDVVHVGEERHRSALLPVVTAQVLPELGGEDITASVRQGVGEAGEVSVLAFGGRHDRQEAQELRNERIQNGVEYIPVAPPSTAGSFPGGLPAPKLLAEWCYR